MRWCETVEYYTDVWASDEDQALETFYDVGMDKIPIGKTGKRDFEMDTIQVEEQ